MVGTHSQEARIDSYLRHLQCSGESFIGIIRNLGLRISSGQLSEVLRRKRKPFDQETGARLLEILGRMNELHESVGVPIDWSRSDEVAICLLNRLVAQVAGELHDPGINQFEKYAKDAAQFVR